jgi:enamine deaminase RidA (YjgF/YER057c/UK114 family)
VVQHAGDAGAQTTTAFSVIEKALAQVGLGLRDIVRNRIYISDGAYMDDVAAAHGKLFGEIRPALTILSGVAFIDPAMLVEIESDAYSSTPLV